MAVKIRLSRIGKKANPFHRIVVVDSREKRDGAILAKVGTYDGLKSTLVTFDEQCYLDWMSKGAQPTDSAKKLYKLFKNTNTVAAQELAETSQPKKNRTKKSETAAV